MDSKPESATKRRSLVILRSAVSVIWSGRKPDWNFTYKLLREMTNNIAIIFSIILDEWKI